MAAAAADADWRAKLRSSRTGSRLAAHLDAMDALEVDPGADGPNTVHNCTRDGAVAEAVADERIFAYALARAAHRGESPPFGLPERLPRFIAILNLSGERLLVHADEPALLRCLCDHSAALPLRELAKALVAFESFPMAADAARGGHARFVLLTYALPWQAGPRAQRFDDRPPCRERAPSATPRRR